MFLREIELKDKEELVDMYKEYLIAKPIDGIDTFEGIRDFEKLENITFEEWLEILDKEKDEKNLPENYSPSSLYIAIENNKIVGAINIRWKYVPVLKSYGGLIGYSIRPSSRGNGYANEMLRLALDEFKNTDIKKILITCKDFNIASKKTIERNGGVFENALLNENDGYTYLRYWIENNK